MKKKKIWKKYGYKFKIIIFYLNRKLYISKQSWQQQKHVND